MAGTADNNMIFEAYAASNKPQVVNELLGAAALGAGAAAGAYAGVRDLPGQRAKRETGEPFSRAATWTKKVAYGERGSISETFGKIHSFIRGADYDKGKAQYEIEDATNRMWKGVQGILGQQFDNTTIDSETQQPISQHYITGGQLEGFLSTLKLNPDATAPLPLDKYRSLQAFKNQVGGQAPPPKQPREGNVGPDQGSGRAEPPVKEPPTATAPTPAAPVAAVNGATPPPGSTP